MINSIKSIWLFAKESPAASRSRKLLSLPNNGRGHDTRAGPLKQDAAIFHHGYGPQIGNTTFSPDFSPRLDAAGRAGLQPRRLRAFLIIPVSRAPRSLRLQAARGAGHGNNQKGPLTAGLKPRPSKIVVRNPG